MQNVINRWDQADAYERFMGRWSRLVALEFVHWLDIPPGATWLDVGCGTGALLQTVASAARPSRLGGVDPSEQFLATAAERVPDADLRQGDAQSIPFESDSFDAVISGLVLNFVPDPVAALREMRRVARTGGTVSAYVWDYAQGMQYLRRFWDAAVALDPSAADLDEGRRGWLATPDGLEGAFADAGLADVTGTALVVPTTFGGFDDYWTPFLAGQGPAGGYVAGLPADRRSTLESRLRSTLGATGSGPIHLTAQAWAVRASVR